MKKILATALVILVIIVGCFIIPSLTNDDDINNSAQDTQYTQGVNHESEHHDSEHHDGDHHQYYFRNQSNLDSHYHKHGIEMGFSSAEEYEQAASDVVNDSRALHKLEAEDGDDVYYIEETNEFVVVSTDGHIRTYFNPDAGKSYFDRQ